MIIIHVLAVSRIVKTKQFVRQNESQKLTSTPYQNNTILES